MRTEWVVIRLVPHDHRACMIQRDRLLPDQNHWGGRVVPFFGLPSSRRDEKMIQQIIV
jgi:hypothetical protein